MSTTLVPPTYYIVKPQDHSARQYNTLTEAAAAVYLLAPAPATVSALTGSRRRSLTEVELQTSDRTSAPFASTHEHKLSNRRGARPQASSSTPMRPVSRSPTPRLADPGVITEHASEPSSQYLTDGVKLYRYVGTIPSPMGHMIRRENCHSLDVTLSPIGELRAERLRTVTPAAGR